MGYKRCNRQNLTREESDSYMPWNAKDSTQDEVFFQNPSTGYYEQMTQKVQTEIENSELAL